MEQDTFGKSRGFHLEISSVEDFKTLCAIIRGETDTAETQARIDVLTGKLNQSSDSLAAALDQQKKEK